MAGLNGPDPNGPNVPRAGLYPGEYPGPMRGSPGLDPYDLARQKTFNDKITGGDIRSLEVGDILQRKDKALIKTKYKHPGYTYGIVRSKEEGDYVNIYGQDDPDKFVIRIGGNTLGPGRTLLSDFVMIEPYDTRRMREKKKIIEQERQVKIAKKKEETKMRQSGIIQTIQTALSENKKIRVKFTYQTAMQEYTVYEGTITVINISSDPVTVTVKTDKIGNVTVSLDEITIIHAGGKRKEKKSRKNRKRKNSRRTRNKT